MIDKTLEDSKTNGRWTSQQHKKFMKGLQLFGKDWKKIEALVGTRNGAQIRSHAQKYFLKNKKEADIFDIWEQTKQTPSEPLSSHSNILKLTSEKHATYPHSYFLDKILEKTTQNSISFDFWNQLIDQHLQVEETTSCCQQRRDSFVIINEQASDWERLQPLKKVKLE